MWPFTKRPKRFTPQDDCVWYDANALRVGAANDALRALASTPVLIITHFPASLDQAESTLQTIGARSTRLKGPFNVAAMCTTLNRLEPRVMALVQSDHLKPTLTPTDEIAARTTTTNPALTVIAWERYPLRAKDNALTAFITELNAWLNCTLRFHAALDTPPMSMFAADTTRNILQRLGMEETECIQHPMLSKSLAKAQAKVAEKANVDPKPGARSAAEWFEAWKLDRTLSGSA
jgi:hypothetical protein